MPYDESLAGRVSVALALKQGIEKKKLFGGIGFLLDGNMLVGGLENVTRRSDRPACLRTCTDGTARQGVRYHR